MEHQNYGACRGPGWSRSARRTHSRPRLKESAAKALSRSRFSLWFPHVTACNYRMLHTGRTVFIIARYSDSMSPYGSVRRRSGRGFSTKSFGCASAENRTGILRFAQDDTYTVRDVGHPHRKPHGPSRRDFIAPQGDTSMASTSPQVSAGQHGAGRGTRQLFDPTSADYGRYGVPSGRNYPTQANCGLEWATNHSQKGKASVFVPRESYCAFTGTWKSTPRSWFTCSVAGTSSSAMGIRERGPESTKSVEPIIA